MRNTIDGPLGLTTCTLDLQVYENEPRLPTEIAYQYFHSRETEKGCILSATYILPDGIDITKSEVPLSILYEISRQGEGKLDNPPIMLWSMRYSVLSNPHICIQVVGDGSMIPFHLISGSDQSESLLQIMQSQFQSALKGIQTNRTDDENTIAITIDNFSGQRIGLGYILESIAPQFARLEHVSRDSLSEKFILNLDSSES
jgi:hypothetical protein